MHAHVTWVKLLTTSCSLSCLRTFDAVVLSSLLCCVPDVIINRARNRCRKAKPTKAKPVAKVPTKRTPPTRKAPTRFDFRQPRRACVCYELHDIPASGDSVDVSRWFGGVDLDAIQTVYSST